MRRGSQKRCLGKMPSVDLRMRHSRENGEVLAMLLEKLQIGRQLIIAPGLRGKKVRSVEAERGADGQKSARRRRRFAGASSRRESIQQWQREGDTGAVQELATRD